MGQNNNDEDDVSNDGNFVPVKKKCPMTKNGRKDDTTDIDEPDVLLSIFLLRGKQKKAMICCGLHPRLTIAVGTKRIRILFCVSIT